MSKTCDKCKYNLHEPDVDVRITCLCECHYEPYESETQPDIDGISTRTYDSTTAISYYGVMSRVTRYVQGYSISDGLYLFGILIRSYCVGVAQIE